MQTNEREEQGLLPSQPYVLMKYINLLLHLLRRQKHCAMCSRSNSWYIVSTFENISLHAQNITFFKPIKDNKV
jgi:hypothetical protein